MKILRLFVVFNLSATFLFFVAYNRITFGVNGQTKSQSSVQSSSIYESPTAKSEAESILAEDSDIAEKVDKLLTKCPSPKTYGRKEYIKVLVKIGNPAVPYLVEVLKGKDESYEKYIKRVSAIEALGIIGDSRAVEPLIKFLLEEADPLRFPYLVRDALIKIGKPSVGPLIKLLENKNYREVAAQALGRIKEPEAIDFLAKELKDKSQSYSEIIARSLGDMWPLSKKVAPDLIEALERGNVGATWFITQDEVMIKEAISAMLKGAIKDPRSLGGYGFKRELFNRMNKEQFMDLFKKFDQKEKDFLLILYLTNQSFSDGMSDLDFEYWVKLWRQERDAKELFSNPIVVEKLSILDQLEPQVLKRYVECIIIPSYEYNDTRFGDYGSYAANGLSDRTNDIRLVELAGKSTVVKFLIQDGTLKLSYELGANVAWLNDDVPQLERFLNGEDDYYRKAAAKVLREIKEQNQRFKSMDQILEVLTEGSAVDRYIALNILKKGANVPERCLPYLIKNLHTDSFWIHQLVITNLVKIGQPAVDSLIKTLDDKDENVCEGAASALGKIGDKRAVGSLLKILNKEFFGLKDPTVITGEYAHSAAAKALGEIGDSRALESLTKIAKDLGQQPCFINAAKEAIEKIQKNSSKDIPN